jgi:rhamnosyltransferase
MNRIVETANDPRSSHDPNLLASPVDGEGRPIKRRIIVPTLNAAPEWKSLSDGLLDCASPEEVTIIDSASTDETVDLARAAGFHIVSINAGEFNHGGTRQIGADLFPDAELIVYLTQDAILAGPESIEALLRAFEDPLVGAAYGRQLPRKGAAPIESHARIFNYPSVSHTRDIESRHTLGVKAAFLSNSFAAYRRSALLSVGGFPSDVIFGEDMVTAARLLMADWKVAYIAEACVYHSHAYTWRQEFRRYFDIGALHRHQSWLQQTFGRASDEGLRYFKSEIAYLSRHRASLIPVAILRTALKYTGYKLGRMERLIAPVIKRKLSLHHRYWISTGESPRVIHAKRQLRGNLPLSSDGKRPLKGWSAK